MSPRASLLAGFVATALSASASHAATLDAVASVVGTASDSGYDGLFETLRDDYAAGEFATTTAGRVFGSFESERRSILEFAIDPIPRATAVSNATLRMRFASASTERGVYAVFGREGDGLLSTSDATETAVLAGAQPRSFDLEVDVTPFVQDLVDVGAVWAGFTVLEWVDGVNTDFAVGFGFFPSSPPPTLHVEYAPEPGTTWPQASVLAALASLAARRALGPAPRIS